MFVVPGNHDVSFTLPDAAQRIQNYIRFDNDLLQNDSDRPDPDAVARVHDRLDDLGAIVLTLTSAMYVQQGKQDQDRGQLDLEQRAGRAGRR